MCSFQCSLRFHHHFTLFQDTSRRYENKAGSFITGIDVTSKVIFMLWLFNILKIQKHMMLPNKIWRTRSFSASSQNCTSSRLVAHGLHKRSLRCQSEKFSGASSPVFYECSEKQIHTLVYI